MVTNARTVAVVGAGWAGLSAAVRLVDQGHRVTLYDAAHEPGGRARAFQWAAGNGHDQRVDNGQHIMIGAYREMLDLLAHIGVTLASVVRREPLTLVDSRGLYLKARRLPAPLHLAMGVLLARGLTPGGKLSMMKLMQRAKRDGFRIEGDRPVTQWLEEQSQPRSVIERIWAPLCVAALNTPARIASTQIFLNVLRDSLGADRTASDFLLPTVPLDEIVPVAAVRYLVDHGAQLALGQPVEKIAVDLNEVTLTLRGGNRNFDAAVVAVPAHQIGNLLSSVAGDSWTRLLLACASFTWQPITTVYLIYDRPITLSAAMMALIEEPEKHAFGQWVFARGALGGPADTVAVVISAEGRHRDIELKELVTLVDRQLRDQVGIVAALVASRCVTEKRATFAAVPDLPRPSNKTGSNRITLAGDYTESDYPATLEGALRSGRIAAEQLAINLARG
jgi:hydroxysqualene dehydroxylase